jgi:queuine tRNA-ribosyltransferase
MSLFAEIQRDTVSRARCGKLLLGRGEVSTPAFMPVGTAASIKGVEAEVLEHFGYQLLLCNTYHLALRPGAELIAQLGGLHRFMGWEGSILTDSGGYQVFSLAALRQITDQGVTFRSHLDGSLVELTPERALEIQRALGSDIMMALDVCPPHDACLEEQLRACRLTTAWAERCLAARERLGGGLLFGIVQGGTDLEMRRWHLEQIAALPFAGLALGGLSVGEDIARRYRVLEEIGPLMDPARPHYLMGVGRPADILQAVSCGMDLFDCVLPTRNGRHGQLFSWEGEINIRKASFMADDRPPAEGCHCPTCRRYSRAYLRHLFQAGEMLGPRLATLHNLFFFAEFMAEIRRRIAAGSFTPWARALLVKYSSSSISSSQST